MEQESHVGDNNVVSISQESVTRMISELTRSEGIEATDPSKDSALFGKFIIDER